MAKMFQNFEDPRSLRQYFNNEQLTNLYLENLRWANDVCSPFDETSKVYKCSNGEYRCKNTGRYFNAKTRTIFAQSRIPLSKWFLAIFLLQSASYDKSPISIANELSVSQKTALNIIRKLRPFIATQKSEISTAKMSDWLLQLKK